MYIYLVHLKAVPSSGSEEVGEVGGAYVHSFVRAVGLVDAATKAIDYVMSRKWLIEEQNDILVMTEERIATLDAHDSAAYQRAINEGQCTYFAAWPLTERDDDLVEIRRLKDKDASGGTTH